MPDNYAMICLLGAMDRLWFHQIILFSEPTNSLLFPKPPNIPLYISQSFTYDQPSSCISIPEEDILLSDASAVIPDQQDNDSEIEDMSEKIIELKEERPSRLISVINLASKTRSHYSSTRKLMKSLSYSGGSVTRLQKTISCKSLSELEVEEVKGFMDLGFRFDKDHLCPRMMSVVPGLQRLGSYNSVDIEKDMIDEVVLANKDDEIVEEDKEEERSVMRPYLSEAWLIKRPDSPLLNLRIPRVSAAADLKRHLKYWARTVASVIQQES